MCLLCRADLDPPLRDGWFACRACRCRADLVPPSRGGWLACRQQDQLQNHNQDQHQTLSRPFGATSHFLLLAQEKVTKEKGTPDFPRSDFVARISKQPSLERSPARTSLCGSSSGRSSASQLPSSPQRCSESVGRRDRAQRRRRLRSSRCRAAAERAHPCAQTCAPFPAGFFRYSAENKRGFRTKSQEPASITGAASLASLVSEWHRCARHRLSEAAVAVAPAVALGFWGPHSARAEQRSQGRGKGAHVRAHGCASSRRPGHGEQRREPRELHPRGARLGCPSLWLLSLGQARESDSRPEGARKLLLCRTIGGLRGCGSRRALVRLQSPLCGAARLHATSGRLDRSSPRTVVGKVGRRDGSNRLVPQFQPEPDQ